MNRKDFLKSCARITGTGLALPWWLSSCMSVAYIPHTEEGGRWVVDKANLAEHPFVLFQPAYLPAPVYLTRLTSGGYSALLLKCTHRGCEVRPAASELSCPCHGSVFSNTGEVLESPAERPLHRFEVSENENHLYISNPS